MFCDQWIQTGFSYWSDHPVMRFEILYFICQTLMTGRVQKGKHGSLTLVAPSVIANANEVKMFGSVFFKN